MLEDNEYQIYVAYDCEMAVSLITIEQPTLVIMDTNLTQSIYYIMNIKQIFPFISMIILSGNGSPISVGLGTTLDWTNGIDAIMSRSLDSSVVNQTINTLIRKDKVPEGHIIAHNIKHDVLINDVQSVYA
jgi:DNA-binding response OmpR family regulator